MSLSPKVPRAFAPFGLILAGLLALAPPGSGVKDVDDDREFRRSAMQRSVRENCLYCHSDEMIRAQRLTETQWKAEVEKMVGWGSPLPKEDHQSLIGFLASEYPADAPPDPLARISYQDAEALKRPDSTPELKNGEASRGGPVYVKNCANCHGPEGQGSDLGPSLVEKPVLWRVADYTEVTRHGRGRMPGFRSTVKPAEEADILAWLRSKRFTLATK